MAKYVSELCMPARPFAAIKRTIPKLSPSSAARSVDVLFDENTVQSFLSWKQAAGLFRLCIQNFGDHQECFHCIASRIIDTWNMGVTGPRLSMLCDYNMNMYENMNMRLTRLMQFRNNHVKLRCEVLSTVGSVNVFAGKYVMNGKLSCPFDSLDSELTTAFALCSRDSSFHL